MFPYFEGKPIKREGNNYHLIHAPNKRSMRVGSGFPSLPLQKAKGEKNMNDKISKSEQTEKPKSPK